MLYDEILGIILARKGSKRLPGKNIVFLTSEGLINIVFRKAKTAGIKNIVLSTDDEKLVELVSGGRLDLTIMERPEDLAGDNISSEAVIYSLLETLGQYYYKYFCLLQLTSPLFSNLTFRKALLSVYENDLDGCVGVTPAYKPSGCYYIIKINAFMENYKKHPEQGLWIPGIYIVEQNWNECIDIDYIYDLRIADAVFNNYVVW